MEEETGLVRQEYQCGLSGRYVLSPDKLGQQKLGELGVREGGGGATALLFR